MNRCCLFFVFTTIFFVYSHIFAIFIVHSSTFGALFRRTSFFITFFHSLIVGQGLTFLHIIASSCFIVVTTCARYHLLFILAAISTAHFTCVSTNSDIWRNNQ